MINKIINQIWIGPYAIPQREQQFANEIRESHPDYEYHLWTDLNLPPLTDNQWKMYRLFYEKEDYVYAADLIRFVVVQLYGGWYFDIDFQLIKNLNEYEIGDSKGVVFGHWGQGWTHCDYTLANGLFYFEKDNPLAKYITGNMPVDLGYCHTPYSPGWFGMIVKKYLGLPNEFCSEIWEYHRIMKEKLAEHNIMYGDYNRFQNENFKHYALYAWSQENKQKFKNGEIK